MATHSSILAWRIPWTEEPGGLQTMGSQKYQSIWAPPNLISFLLSSMKSDTFNTHSPIFQVFHADKRWEVIICATSGILTLSCSSSQTQIGSHFQSHEMMES